MSTYIEDEDSYILSTVLYFFENFIIIIII